MWKWDISVYSSQPNAETPPSACAKAWHPHRHLNCFVRITFFYLAFYILLDMETFSSKPYWTFLVTPTNTGWHSASTFACEFFLVLILLLTTVLLQLTPLYHCLTLALPFSFWPLYNSSHYWGCNEEARGDSRTGPVGFGPRSATLGRVLSCDLIPSPGNGECDSYSFRGLLWCLVAYVQYLS